MTQTTDLQLDNALCELTRCRGSLRNHLTSALDLAARVVLEQRPPFCGAFLHVHRLLLQLNNEALSYFEMEEALLPARSGLDARYPAGGRSALAAMLRSGQGALSALFADLREATHGFQPVPEGGGSYEALVNLLREIHTELVLQFRLEEREIFPKLTLDFAGVRRVGSQAGGLNSPSPTAGAEEALRIN